MITNEKELFSLIDGIFKPIGYVKKKETWYLHSSECICFFTIGKSFYSGKYGQAFGCFLKELNRHENKEFPEYNKSDLRISLSFFRNEDVAESVFNLENREFVKDERELAVKDLIEMYTLPFLETVATKHGIRDASIKYPLLKNYIKALALRYKSNIFNWL